MSIWAGWRRWISRARVEYLSLWAVIGTLLATVIFSCLGWCEARKAAELQREMFLAQNAPYIEVSSVRIIPDEKTPELLITVKNTGDSESKSLCISVLTFELKSILPCSKGPFEEMQIEKSKTFDYVVPFNSRVREAFGLVPTKAALLGSGGGRPPCTGARTSVVVVPVSFNDAFGGRRATLAQLLLCGDPLNKAAVKVDKH